MVGEVVCCQKFDLENLENSVVVPVSVGFSAVVPQLKIELKLFGLGLSVIKSSFLALNCSVDSSKFSSVA